MRSVVAPSPLTGCPGGQLFQHVPESIFGPGGGQRRQELPVQAPSNKDRKHVFKEDLQGAIKELKQYAAQAAQNENQALTELMETERDLAIATARHSEAVQKLLAARKERAAAAQSVTALSVVQNAMHSPLNQPFTQAMETFHVALQAPSVAFTHSQT